MSHKTTIKTSLKDLACLAKAAETVGAQFRRAGTSPLKVELYSEKVDAVAAVRLRGWKYEVAVQEDGKVAFDNYNGGWGDEKELDKLNQQYGVELWNDSIQQHGYREIERVVQEDGSIHLLATA